MLLNIHNDKALLHNPVFVAELQHIQWANTPEKLRRYNRRVLFGVLAIALLWWVLERIASNPGVIPLDTPEVVILFLISLAVTLVSSLYTTTLTVNGIQTLLTSGKWDELRVTLQSEKDLVQAYDGIALIRAWRLSILETALRMATTVLLLLNYCYGTWIQDGQQFDVFMSRAAFLSVGLVVFGTVLASYSIEPLLRVQVIVALCTAFALRLKSLALFAGFTAAFLIHLLQIGAIAGIAYLIRLPVAPSGNSTVTLLVGCLGPPCAAIILVFYSLYQTLSKSALRLAISKHTS